MRNFKELIIFIKEDLNRLSNTKNSYFKLIKFLITNASFKVTFWFRLGSYLKDKKYLKPLYFLSFIIYKMVQFKTGIQLPIGTTVGKGLQFSHFSCIVINNDVIIGDYCTIFQGVTIGSVRGKGAPRLGNHVVLAAGSKVLGNVSIGNFVFIGANAVVISDVIDLSVMGGIPAKVLNYNGKKNTLMYLHN